MPQIKEVTAQTDVLRPSETGVEAFAGAGRRAGAFYNQAAESLRQSAQDEARAAGAVAQADELKTRAFEGTAKSVGEAVGQAAAFEGHQNVVQLVPAFSNRDLDTAQKYNAILSDPNAASDPSVFTRFQEQVLEPAADEMRQAATTPEGQRYAEQHIRSMYDHYATKIGADQSIMAGVAVKNAIETSRNALTNKLYLDGTDLPRVLGTDGRGPGTIDTNIAAMVDSNPNIRGPLGERIKLEMGLEAKQDAVKAAFMGAVRRSPNPDAIVQQFQQKYSDWITPAEAVQLSQVAKATTRADQVDQERTDRLNKEQVAAKSRAKMDVYYQKILDDDPNIRSQVRTKDILHDNDLTFPDRKELIGILNNEGKTQISNDAVKSDLRKRLVDPDQPTSLQEVANAYSKGDLNPKDFKELYGDVRLAKNAVFEDPSFKMTVRDVEKMIGGGVNDPRGEELQATFNQKFMRAYGKASRDGTLKPNALDIMNPDSLISQTLRSGPFLRTMSQRMMDRTPFGSQNLGDITGMDVEEQGGPGAPRPAPPGGFVNVPPQFKTPDQVKTWAKSQGYAPDTKFKLPDGTILGTK